MIVIGALDVYTHIHNMAKPNTLTDYMKKPWVGPNLGPQVNFRKFIIFRRALLPSEVAPTISINCKVKSNKSFILYHCTRMMIIHCVNLVSGKKKKNLP